MDSNPFQLSGPDLTSHAPSLQHDTRHIHALSSPLCTRRRDLCPMLRLRSRRRRARTGSGEARRASVVQTLLSDPRASPAWGSRPRSSLLRSARTPPAAPSPPIRRPTRGVSARAYRKKARLKERQRSAGRHRPSPTPRSSVRLLRGPSMQVAATRFSARDLR
jgi:hypothetical protein